MPLSIPDYLSYDPLTGIITWKVDRGPHVKAGDVAGCERENGYIYITLFDVQHLAHRVAWLLYYGAWPDCDLDHVDTITTHNWISNLRRASKSQNQCNRNMHKNNTSGVKGVSWNKSMNKWVGSITCNRIHYHVGYFYELSDATEAVRAKREELHKQFTNHGHAT